jgi:hypothetical protein
MQIDPGRIFQIGENKKIKVISIECLMPSGYAYYSCEVVRPYNKTIGVYSGGHIAALVKRYLCNLEKP